MVGWRWFVALVLLSAGARSAVGAVWPERSTLRRPAPDPRDDRADRRATSITEAIFAAANWYAAYYLVWR